MAGSTAPEMAEWQTMPPEARDKVTEDAAEWRDALIGHIAAIDKVNQALTARTRNPEVAAWVQGEARLLGGILDDVIGAMLDVEERAERRALRRIPPPDSW